MKLYKSGKRREPVIVRMGAQAFEPDDAPKLPSAPPSQIQPRRPIGAPGKQPEPNSFKEAGSAVRAGAVASSTAQAKAPQPQNGAAKALKPSIEAKPPLPSSEKPTTTKGKMWRPLFPNVGLENLGSCEDWILEKMRDHLTDTKQAHHFWFKVFSSSMRSLGKAEIERLLGEGQNLYAAVTKSSVYASTRKKHENIVAFQKAQQAKKREEKAAHEKAQAQSQDA